MLTVYYIGEEPDYQGEDLHGIWYVEVATEFFETEQEAVEYCFTEGYLTEGPSEYECVYEDEHGSRYTL